MSDYAEFLKSKERSGDMLGFKPVSMPDFLFFFQRHLVDWSIRKGRAAIFADCGLGKTAMELAWANNMVRKTNKPALVFTPLAVAPQFVREGEKFGIECRQARDGSIKKGINVVNYERIHLFNPNDFCAVVCDESGILKNYLGKIRKQATEFLSKVKYRLLASATPSPNDWMELGNSSEALGAMGRFQMLGMFFTNCGESTGDWELKGHAKRRFWRWVATWARALRKPSDLGFTDEGFDLPELITEQHVVIGKNQRMHGFLPRLAKTLDEQRAERRETVEERCDRVAKLVKGKKHSVVWCHLNPEGDLLEKIIPGAVQVSGRDRDDEKEEKLSAFSEGKIKVLVTKPKIGGFGLNWQHCAHMTVFPSHSFEQYYQAVRRCWRFGQKNPVKVDIVTSEGESLVLSNMRNKERAMDEMFTQLVMEMGEFQVGKKQQEIMKKMELPKWL